MISWRTKVDGHHDDLRKKNLSPIKNFFTHTHTQMVLLSNNFLFRLIKYKFLGVKVKFGSEISLSYIM